MDREGAFSEIARGSPDRASALVALHTASDLLLLAREHYSHGNFREAAIESRNAIRLASSALLFSDGVVSASLDSTLTYLFERHPGALPLDDWQRLEETPDADSPGLYILLLAAMGKLKRTGEQDAKEAIIVAEAFIASAMAEMSL
ncbi:MAG: hypothetical protein V1861_01570 [Candidatus Micrarchaeota archaeon]